MAFEFKQGASSVLFSHQKTIFQFTEKNRGVKLVRFSLSLYILHLILPPLPFTSVHSPTELYHEQFTTNQKKTQNTNKQKSKQLRFVKSFVCLTLFNHLHGP